MKSRVLTMRRSVSAWLGSPGRTSLCVMTRNGEESRACREFRRVQLRYLVRSWRSACCCWSSPAMVSPRPPPRRGRRREATRPPRSFAGVSFRRTTKPSRPMSMRARKRPRPMSSPSGKDLKHRRRACRPATTRPVPARGGAGGALGFSRNRWSVGLGLGRLARRRLWTQERSGPQGEEAGRQAPERRAYAKQR